MNKPTYIFKNGNVYTVVGGKVVASVKEADFADQGPVGGHEIHEPHGGMEMPPPPPGLGGDDASAYPCVECGGQPGPDGRCLQCGAACEPQQAEHQGLIPGGMGTPDPNGIEPPRTLDGPHIGSFITTPNGLKGEVLGKTASMWGDEVTVRFENGRIVRLPVSEGLKTASAPAPAKTVTASLDERLAASVDGTRDGLTARVSELEAVERTARSNIGSSHDTNSDMARIAAEARAEIVAAKQAIAHLDSVAGEAYRPPTPTYQFGHVVVAQETLGGGDASWLDHTVNDMIREAEMNDYEQLMDEGPEAFVAGLDDSTVANQGVTHAVASRYIRSKTAGTDEATRDQYEKVWLARVEQVRRSQIANRKQAARKEAASQEADYSNLPDDVLFS